MKEFNEFFTSKGFPLKKIVEGRPKDVSEEDVISAAYELYEEIKKGAKEVRDIQIPRIIWNKARKNKLKEKKFFVDVVDTKPLVEEVHQKVKKVEDEIKEKTFDLQTKVDDIYEHIERKINREEFKEITRKVIADYKEAVRNVEYKLEDAKNEISKLWQEKERLEKKLKQDTITIEILVFIIIILTIIEIFLKYRM